MNRARAIRKSRIKSRNGGRSRHYRKFPFERIAKMWLRGKTIAAIAKAIGRIDKNPKDPYHTMRNCLYRMHKGYRNSGGRMVKLPHRVSPATIRASRKAGLSASA